MPLNRKARFALPALIDREDEENIFFVLEELGLAHLQSMWIKKHEPERSGAAAVHAQEVAFFGDLLTILSGEAQSRRVKPNTWAGDRLASHLAVSLGLDGQTDKRIIREAMERFLDDLNLLTSYEQSVKAAGRVIPSKDYNDLMEGWSALFAGKANRLLTPLPLLLHKVNEMA